MKKYKVTFTPALKSAEVEAKSKKEAIDIAWDYFDEWAQCDGDVQAKVEEIKKGGKGK